MPHNYVLYSDFSSFMKHPVARQCHAIKLYNSLNSVSWLAHSVDGSASFWLVIAERHHCTNKTVILTQLLCCLSCKHKAYFLLSQLQKMISHRWDKPNSCLNVLGLLISVAVIMIKLLYYCVVTYWKSETETTKYLC